MVYAGKADDWRAAMKNLGTETETLEFKKTTGELKEGIISLSSMLNKNGHGVLYFGVKDSGDVGGSSSETERCVKYPRQLRTLLNRRLFRRFLRNLLTGKM